MCTHSGLIMTTVTWNAQMELISQKMDEQLPVL